MNIFQEKIFELKPKMYFINTQNIFELYFKELHDFLIFLTNVDIEVINVEYNNKSNIIIRL